MNSMEKRQDLLSLAVALLHACRALHVVRRDLVVKVPCVAIERLVLQTHLRKDTVSETILRQTSSRCSRRRVSPEIELPYDVPRTRCQHARLAVLVGKNVVVLRYRTTPECSRQAVCRGTLRHCWDFFVAIRCNTSSPETIVMRVVRHDVDRYTTGWK